MATIFYSVMGEGRGHAARARTMIDQLRDRHRIVVYTSLDALAFLRSAYPENSRSVEIRQIEGLPFHYTAGRIDLMKTVAHGIGMWFRQRKLIQPLVDDIDRDRPALLITDFEPLLPRAAQRRKVPIVSLDHQHFLTAYDLKSLPRRLRLYAWGMSWCVWAFGIKQQKTVISAFYKPPLRRAWKSAVQVGPLLRSGLKELTPRVGDFVLSYLRRHTPQRVVDLLSALDLPVRIYGLGSRDSQGSATFHEVDETAFTADLAACGAVIAAAGNQLTGESLYFGKPTLALPEQIHHEQCINAHFLKQLGGGDYVELESLTPENLRHFLESRETFRHQLAGRTAEFDGNAAALAAVESMLPAEPAPPAAAPLAAKS